MKKTALNPALGLRAIRYCLSEPKNFSDAIARHFARLRIWKRSDYSFPMITHAFEIEQTLAMIEQAKGQLQAAGLGYDENIQIGAMIEVPRCRADITLVCQSAGLPFYRHQ